MTEPTLPGSVQRGLMYYQSILSGTLAGQSTAQIWEGIRAQAEAMGLPSPGISVTTVSMIRGLAGSEARAMQGLANAQPFEPALSYASTPPWARSLSERNAAPSFLVRFAVAGQTDDLGNQIWRSVRYDASNMPYSVSDLVSDLGVQNAAMSADYGTEDQGILDVLDDGTPGISIHAF